MLRFFKSIFIVLVFFAFNLPVFSQSDAEVEIGGKASCRFSGGFEQFNKKIKSKENSFVIDLSNESIEFNIEAIFSTSGEDFAISVYAPISDINIDSLLSGKLINAKSFESELSLVKSTEEDSIEISNLDEDKDGLPIESPVLVKITNYSEATKEASGNIRIRYPNTILIQEENDDEEVANGKVVVTCSFKGVPVTFSESTQ